jgi:hypothetical protein
MDQGCKQKGNYVLFTQHKQIPGQGALESEITPPLKILETIDNARSTVCLLARSHYTILLPLELQAIATPSDWKVEWGP